MKALPVRPISFQFSLVVETGGIIICAKFCDHIFKEYDATQGLNSAFPIRASYVRWDGGKLLQFGLGENNAPRDAPILP